MAYTHDQVEYLLSSSQVVTSTGNKLTWSPGYVPHLIRAVSVNLIVVPTVTATVVNFTTRATIGSDTGITAGDIAILNLLTTYAIGNVVYKDGIAKKLSPKQEMVVNVGTASTAGTCAFYILVEPTWEMPANNTNMIATT